MVALLEPLINQVMDRHELELVVGDIVQGLNLSFYAHNVGGCDDNAYLDIDLYNTDSQGYELDKAGSVSLGLLAMPKVCFIDPKQYEVQYVDVDMVVSI